MNVRLPGNILNTGLYNISLAAGIHRVSMLKVHESIVEFSVDFKTLNQVMPVNKRRGYIAPLLVWANQKLR